MELQEIEFWENHYLNEIEFLIKQDVDKMMDGLTSKDKIREDWIDVFLKRDKKSHNSDIARGAERIYFWLFNQLGIPNSSPIGADMFFETYNAFVHIDVKTANLNNTSDYKGKVPIGKNQTSYKPIQKNYEVNLPYIYNYNNKLCLTYIINIIHEESDIKGVFLICIPNGLLESVYGDAICNASKNKGEAFRYKYSAYPCFKLLEEKPLRIRILHLSDDFINKEEKLIGFKISEVDKLCTE